MAGVGFGRDAEGRAGVVRASDGDLYEVLGVGRDASPDEIRRAYRTAAKKFHPDTEGNSYFFRLIQQAYETLGDPARRAAYDRDDRTPPAPQEPPTRSQPLSVPTIPLEEIAWWSRVDPAAPISWRGRFALVELVFVLLCAAWLALVGFGLATPTLAAAGGYGYLVFCVVMVPTAWCLGSGLLGRKPAKGAVLGSVVAGGLLVLLTWFAETHSLPHPGTIFGYAIGALITPWLAAKFAPYRSRQRIDWRANVWQLQPGGQASVIRSDSCAGLTAELLARYFTRIPGVRIFRDPGLGTGVDHLVLCGRRMVLIGSVTWPAGDYTLSRNGEVLLDGQRTRVGSPGVAQALRACRRRFRRAQVRGVALNWPPDAGPGEKGWTPDRDCAVISPDMLVKEVGGWLAEAPTVVHRGMFRELINARRPPSRN